MTYNLASSSLLKKLTGSNFAHGSLVRDSVSLDSPAVGPAGALVADGFPGPVRTVSKLIDGPAVTVPFTISILAVNRAAHIVRSLFNLASFS